MTELNTSQSIYDTFKSKRTNEFDVNDETFTPSFRDELQFAYLVGDQIDRYNYMSGVKNNNQRFRAADDSSDIPIEQLAEMGGNQYNKYKKYNLNKQLQNIYQQYEDRLDPNDPNYKEERRKLREEFRLATTPLKKDRQNYEIDSSWLAPSGARMLDRVKKYKQRRSGFAKETVEDFVLDLPTEMIKNIGENFTAVADAPKYFFDEEGDELYHNITRSIPLLGGILQTADAFANIKNTSKALFGNDLAYEGYLKENPNVADTLEFAGEMALTLPLEGMTIAGMTIRAGRKQVANKLDAMLNNQSNWITDRAKRWYAGMRLGTRDEIFRTGLRNTIKRGKRDMYYATAAMVGVEGSFQALEAYDYLQPDSWLNYARIPAMLLGGALFPAAIHKGLQYAGMQKGGFYSPIKDLKWHATAKDSSIDSYLEEVLGYDPKSFVDESFMGKLRLARVTRQEYKAMSEFGEAMLELRNYDRKNGTKLFEEIAGTGKDGQKLGWLYAADDTRNRMLNLRAKYTKNESGGYKYRDADGEVGENGFNLFIKENIDEVRKTDKFLDQMLVSEALRAIRKQLSGDVQLPMMQKINAKTLYQDLLRHNKVEAQQRDFIAETLKTYLDDAIEAGDNEAIEFFSNFQKANIKKNIEIGEDTIKAEANMKQELANLIADSESLKTIEPIDLTRNIELDEGDINILNNQLAMMEELGYPPTTATIENLKKFKDNPLLSPTAKNKLVPGEEITKRMESLWTKKYNAILAPLNDKYKAARVSAENIKVGTKEVDDEVSETMAAKFTEIKQRAESEPELERMMTSRLRDTNTFQRYIKQTMIKFLRNEATDDEIATVFKNSVADGDLRNYEWKPPGAEESLTFNKATKKEIVDHMLTKITTEDVNIPLNLDTIQAYRSRLLKKAGNDIGGNPSREAYELADDLKNIIEIGSAPYMDRPGIATFVDANESWAKQYVPLFRRGTGGEVAAKNREGRVIGSNRIMDAFLETGNAAESFDQYRRIFGSDSEADELLRYNIGKKIEKGEQIDQQVIQALVANNIVSPELAEKMLPAFKNLNAKSSQIVYDKNLKLFMNKLTNEAEFTDDVQALANTLKGAAQSKQNAKAIYDIVKDQSPETTAKLLEEMGEGAGESLMTIIAKPLAEEVIRKGNEIVLTTKKVPFPEQITPLGRAEKITDKGADFLGFKPRKNQAGADSTDQAFDRMISRESSVGSDELLTSDDLLGGTVRGDDSLDFKISYMNELDAKLLDNILDVNNEGIATSNLGRIIQKVDPEHFDNLRDITSSAVLTEFTTKAPTPFAGGFATPFRAESIISRIYSVVRGVVSLRYVLTEGGFQAFRNKRVQMLQEMLADPSTTRVLKSVFTKDALRNPAVRIRYLRFLRSYFALPQEVSDQEIINEHNDNVNKSQ